MREMGTQIEKCCESMEEVWKDIEGFEGKYQVNKEGKVRSLLTGKLIKPNRAGGRCYVLHKKLDDGSKKCIYFSMRNEIEDKDGEVWKDIENFEGIYQISNFGRVKSLDRVIDTRNGKSTIKGVIVNPCGKPYLFVYLSKNNKSKYHAIHRLVAQAFIPNLENKPQVNHIDGDKTNNVVSNLEWVTQSENMLHAYRIGLEKPRAGSSNGWSKVKMKIIMPNGEEMLFNSVTECAEFAGIGTRRVRQLRNKRKISEKGYRFEYA
jgi:hypothetical protein